MARQFKPGQLQTGSLYNISSSYAITASYALNGGSTNNNNNSFIATGSVTASVANSGDIFIIKSGSTIPLSINNTGLVTISGSATNLFLVKNTNNQPVLTVSQSGIVVFATQSAELTNPAPLGGIYFTSGSFFIGLG